MVNELKDRILMNWNAMRILRGVLSLIIVVQAIIYHDTTLAVFGGVFALMALFNTGCCAGGACQTSAPAKNTAVKGSDDIEFEEVK